LSCRVSTNVTLSSLPSNKFLRGCDVRAWIALAFGLVHGFGFANVLREFGLPQEALGWSLSIFPRTPGMNASGKMPSCRVHI
jgi:hypothetical protein